MEIKSELLKPYTDKQRIDFIIEQNHRLGYEIRETDKSLQAWGKTDDDYTKEREEQFNEDFFKVQYNEQDLYFRKQPKGYSSAVESINTAFNIVNTIGTLPAGSLVFYQQPDFADETQCTEEWLVEHQVKSEQMSATEFGTFYAGFITAWNTQEHK